MTRSNFLNGFVTGKPCRRIVHFAALTLLSCLHAKSIHAADAIPLAFTQTPQLSDPKLSPSGKWLAANLYARNSAQTYNGLVIFEVTDAGIVPVLRSVDTYRVNNYAWRSDTQLIASTSGGMAEWDLSTKKVRMAGSSSQGVMIDAHWGDKDEILMRALDCTAKYLQDTQQIPKICFSAWDVTNHKTRSAAPSYDGYVDRFFTDRNDVIHVLARTPGGQLVASYFEPGGLDWHSEDPQQLMVPLAEFIGKQVASQSQLNSPEVQQFQQLYDRYGSATAPVRTTNSERLFGAELATDSGVRFVALNTEISAAMEAVQKSFQGYRLSVVGASDDLQRILLSVQSVSDPESYVIFEPKRGKLIRTADLHPALTSITLTTPQTSQSLISPEAPVLVYEAANKNAPRGIVIVPSINVSRSNDPTFPNIFALDLHAFTQLGLRVVGVPLAFPVKNTSEAFALWQKSSAAAIADVARALRKQYPALPICTYGQDRAGYVALAAAASKDNALTCVTAINPVATTQDLFNADINIDNRQKSETVMRIRYLGFMGLDSTNIATPVEISWAADLPNKVWLATQPYQFNIEHIRNLRDAIKDTDKTVTWLSPNPDRDDHGEWQAEALQKLANYIVGLKP